MKLTVGRLVESAAALELEILREDSTAKKNSAAMDQDSPSTILSAKWISEKALKWASFPKKQFKTVAGPLGFIPKWIQVLKTDSFRIVKYDFIFLFL